MVGLLLLQIFAYNSFKHLFNLGRSRHLLRLVVLGHVSDESLFVLKVSWELFGCMSTLKRSHVPPIGAVFSFFSSSTISPDFTFRREASL